MAVEPLRAEQVTALPARLVGSRRCAARLDVAQSHRHCGRYGHITL